MPEITLGDAKAAKDEAQQGNLRETEAGIPDEHRPDYEEDIIVDVRGHAEALVAFDHKADISINTYGDDRDGLLDQEQNLQGAGKYGYNVQITVADPELVEGMLWAPAGDPEYPTYKVIGDPDSDTNDYELRESIIKDDDGTPTGTEIDGIGNLGGSSWDGQPVEGGFDELDADYATFDISASRAVRVLGTLDTAGRWHLSEDGEVREGLFEAREGFFTEGYDADAEGYPRLTGFPELRADMVGQQGAIAFTWGDETGSGNTPKEVDIFKVTDDGLEALVPLTPEDDAYAKPEYPRVNNLYWDHDGTDAVGSDAEPESNGGVEEAKSMLSGDDDSDSDSTSYEDLTDDEQEFVDMAAEAMADHGVDEIDDLGDKSLEERMLSHDTDFDVGAAELRGIINNRS